ncbi:MAG: ATP-binding protein [Cyanobacteria bacterium P01_F01_bin.86]
MGWRRWGDFRWRMVAWYTLLSGFTLLSFDLYLYFQFREGLMQQVDRTLKVAAIQAIKNIDDEGKFLAFNPRQDAPALASLMETAGVSVYLLSVDGTIKGQFGQPLVESLAIPVATGYRTIPTDNKRWRVYTHEIPVHINRSSGWIKVSHSMDEVEAAANSLRQQMLLGTPLVLVLVGVGGFFLANRALVPINKITRTAHQVRLSGDLTQRINYQGSQDELGRFALMFDEMLESLQKTFEREQQFSADVSHELRTPLTVLKGRVNVALSQHRTPEEYEKTLKSIELEVNRLIRLSSDLLLLTQLEQSNRKWHPETVDLSDLLAAITEQMQTLADLKAVYFTSTVDPELTVQGYPDYLICLFLNLLDNGIKHTAPEGKVILAARKHDKTIRVTVKDSGTGIAPEHLPHLFKRFYRVEADRSRRTGGAGLGLAIAQEIAHLHGGSITVQSQPQKGTEFIVLLPFGAVISQR